MKWLFAFSLLLLPVLATGLTSPPLISVTGNQTFDVSVFDAPQGSRLTVSWVNEKVDLFPSMVPLSQSSALPTIWVLPQPGACGKTNVTFTVASTQSITTLDMGGCTVLSGEYNPDNSFLGTKLWALKPKIDQLKYYLLMTREVQSYLDNITSQMAQANAIDITVSQAEFTRKDILTHQIEAQISALDLAFRGINKDLPVASIIQVNDTLDEIGNTYLYGKISEKLGDVEPFDALYYKRKAFTRVSIGNETRDYTLYKILFYNPTTAQQDFLYAEDLPADASDLQPYTNQSITVWNITLAPAELKMVKYGVYKDPQEAITSMAFIQAPPKPTCSDRQRNQNETDVDCGGPCPACAVPEPVATCFDSLWNQGEAGVDCGGPCAKQCSIPLPEPAPALAPAPSSNATAFGPLASAIEFIDSLFSKGTNSTATKFSDNYLALLRLIIKQ